LGIDIESWELISWRELQSKGKCFWGWERILVDWKMVNTGLNLQGQKGRNLYEKPRRGLILAFLGKNTALRTHSTPNSGMGNPILRTEFFILRRFIC
jgi:hypothetical protein